MADIIILSIGEFSILSWHGGADTIVAKIKE